MLGIGLLLFCIRAKGPRAVLNEKIMKIYFWSINIGLMAMVLLSLLPVGLMQTWASVKYGYWYARSAEFLQTDVMTTLRWMRAPGDTLFAFGLVLLAFFVIGMTLKKSFRER